MYCQDCPKRETCQATCKEVENYLQKKQSDKDLLGIDRLYTDRWIRAVEIPYDPNILDQKIFEQKKEPSEDDSA